MYMDENQTDRLAAYVEGTLKPGERAEVEAWLDQHPDWLPVVAKLLAQSQADSISTLAQWGSADVVAGSHGLRPGERIGRYRVIEVAGRGGMGVVYKAHDPALHRSVAMKLVRARAAPDRVIAEAKALAQVHSRNVVAVHDVLTHGQNVVLVMEWLAGVTLRERLRDGYLSFSETTGLFLQIGEGLARAHAAGIFHCDIKPGNIFLCEDGRAVLIDFGLSISAQT